MNVKTFKIILLVMLIPITSKSSIDTPSFWGEIKIKMLDGSIYLKLNKQNKLKTMKLIISGKKFKVKKELLNDIPTPVLSTIKITGGCTFEPLICYKYVSFNYVEELNMDDFPDWYEEPKVIYTFKEGKFYERFQEIKIKKHTWKLIKVNSEGIKTESINNLKD